MAAPTPTAYSRQEGRHGFLFWNATWSTSDQMTGTVLLDLSNMADGYTDSLTVERIVGVGTAGIHFTIAIDATTNEPVFNYPLGCTGAVDIDYTSGGMAGAVKQGGGSTGDLVITTLSAASGDEISLWVWYSVS